MRCGLVELRWGVDWLTWDEVWVGGVGMGCGFVELGWGVD